MSTGQARAIPATAGRATDADRRALEKAARLYYEHGLTHQAIADFLGVSRVKVTRMLAEARNLGLVQIRVMSDVPLFEDLALEVRSRLGLDSVWIAPAHDDQTETRTSVAIVGARVLGTVIAPRSTVAIALSQTLSDCVSHLDKLRLAPLVVPATGQLGGTADGTSSGELSLWLARKLAGRSMHMPAPLLATSEAAADAFRNDEAIASALREASKADLLLAGLGSVTGRGQLVDRFTDADRAELLDLGAVGDVAACFFDADGHPVESSATRRLVRATHEELQRIPRRLVMTTGVNRAVAIDAAARAGLFTMLVTDSRTAEALLVGG